GRSKNNENKFAGRTRQNKLVNFEGGNDDLIGKLVMVKITEPRTFSLNGILVNN
ncbi:TPA: TRAM domain-containing protein, partial [Clostridioides difficile]|nr:TRAM domain-containing protein [Clostridioides difficile]